MCDGIGLLSKQCHVDAGSLAAAKAWSLIDKRTCRHFCPVTTRLPEDLCKLETKPMSELPVRLTIPHVWTAHWQSILSDGTLGLGQS